MANRTKHNYEALSVEERIGILEQRVENIEEDGDLRSLETQRVQAEADKAAGIDGADATLRRLDEAIAAEQEQREKRAEAVRELIEEVRGES